MRYLIEIQYDGTHFYGFQIQKNVPTIQGEIEKSMYIILKEKIQIQGSSRTDTGVHANQNFAHFDTPLILTDNFIFNMNAVLPHSIALVSIKQVDIDFNARFNAISRAYSYQIHYKKSPLVSLYSMFYPLKIDIEKINQATQLIPLYHSFGCFGKKHSGQVTDICTIFNANWEWAEKGAILHISANRFLRGMVRGLVGTLLQVGRGNISMADFTKMLANKSNLKADFSVQAKGLILKEVCFE